MKHEDRPIDPVLRPKHYNALPNGLECINIVQWFNFNLGNAIKYIWRAGLKSSDPMADLLKARNYIDFEIARLEPEAPEPEAINRFWPFGEKVTKDFFKADIPDGPKVNWGYSRRIDGASYTMHYTAKDGSDVNLSAGEVLKVILRNGNSPDQWGFESDPKGDYRITYDGEVLSADDVLALLNHRKTKWEDKETWR